MLPADAGVQHEKDRLQNEAVVQPPAARIAEASLPRRQHRLDPCHSSVTQAIASASSCCGTRLSARGSFALSSNRGHVSSQSARTAARAGSPRLWSSQPSWPGRRARLTSAVRPAGDEAALDRLRHAGGRCRCSRGPASSSPAPGSATRRRRSGRREDRLLGHEPEHPRRHAVGPADPTRSGEGAKPLRLRRRLGRLHEPMIVINELFGASSRRRGRRQRRGTARTCSR